MNGTQLYLRSYKELEEVGGSFSSNHEWTEIPPRTKFEMFAYGFEIY